MQAGFKTAAAAALAFALLATGVSLAQIPGPPQLTPEQIAEMRERQRIADAAPDSHGTGPYSAIYEVDSTLPDHVVYRPANLSAVQGRLGVLAWGNGGCAGDGASARQHLAEIASHGYLVIAPGRILSGPSAPAHAAPPAMPTRGPNGQMQLPPAATTAADVSAGIDWALAENNRSDSRYFGRIDPHAIAVSGHSCGGVQALRIGVSDPRIRAVVVHNSGLFPDGQMGMAEMDMSKSQLNQLRTPVIYIIGGPTDIAYNNARDDFSRFEQVPTVMVNLDVGHGGTFAEPNGGAAARVAVAWLDWQLRDNHDAGRMFTGADCGLCADPAWTIERKGIDE
jgi:dienelactone hydrolase